VAVGRSCLEGVLQPGDVFDGATIGGAVAGGLGG